MKTLAQLLVVALTVLPVFAHGQQQVIREVVINGAMPRAVDQTAQRKQAFERELLLLVGDMQRTCELNEVQVKKLTLASKGAVAAALEKYNKQQKQMRAQMGGFAVPQLAGGEEEEEDDADDDELEEEEEVALARPAVAIAGNFVNLVGGGGMFNANSNVAKEPRWVNAVEKVLTEEQQKKYAAVVKERVAAVRKAAVGAFIAKVDAKLLLSAEQRTKLLTLVDKGFGSEMAKRLGQTSRGVFFFGGGDPVTPPIAHAELKKFLSDVQLSGWQASFEQELRQLNPQGIRGGAFGRGNFILRAPAVIPPVAVPQVDPGDDN